MGVDTVRFEIAGGHVALIDAADWEGHFPYVHPSGFSAVIRPCDRKWRVTGKAKWRYVCCTVERQKRKHYVSLHRLIMQPPPRLVVDHINGNTLDNRRANLRVCTNAENIRNSRINTGSSRFKGVYYDKAKARWKAQIGYDNQRFHIGFYATEEEAAIAYDLKANELFGQYAHLNFPEPKTV